MRMVGKEKSQAGFSVVEGLVAALILLVVLLGVLPLVSRSLFNNSQGNDANMQTSMAMESLETMYSLPFNNQLAMIAAGQTTLTRDEFYLLKGDRWQDVTLGIPAGDVPQFERRLTLEQFNVSDLESDNTLDTPLDGSTPPGSVQLKRYTLTLFNRRGLSIFNTGFGSSYTLIAVQSN